MGELVAVVGGDLDTIIDPLGNVSQSGQYLRVFDMTDPANVVELASPILSFRVGSTITKVRWSPPYLVYQEFAADLHQIGFINLQEMIFGFGSTPVQQDAFPAAGRPGNDLNGDGDYVDANEILPIPERRPIEFYGKKFGYLTSGTTQKVLDFDVVGVTVGVTLTSGIKLDDRGRPTAEAVPPAYRTLAFNGQEPDAQRATVRFGFTAYPRRVSIFDSLAVLVGGVLQTPVLALVSLTPDANGKQKLAIIDITLPESPKPLNAIIIPQELIGGQLQGVRLRPDGLLELGTSANVLILDPGSLAEPNPPAGTLHPAIVGFIPGAGATTRSVGSAPHGLNAFADGGRSGVTQSAPPLKFVQFPTLGTVVDPTDLPKSDAVLVELMGKMSEVDAIASARFRPASGIPSSLVPPKPTAHYHVLVKAPGATGPRLQLGLESLSFAGLPLANRGPGFAPVRAVQPATAALINQKPRPSCDAPVRSLPAFRMSRDPHSPFYNQYLSRPFAVIYERVSTNDLTQLELAPERELISGGDFLRAFIDPGESGNLGVGPFAAAVDTDRKQIRPKAAVLAFSFDSSFIPGDNPPPLLEPDRLPGTFDSVLPHSGEVRTEATDIVLPSPRMPIRIERAIGGQDNYDGPFGLGWDFNYNQRLTPLDPVLFPLGSALPLIDRGTRADSVIGGSRDVLFHSGGGRIILFQWKGASPPAEFTQDPLVRAFKYPQLASDYYLPEAGSFDLLVRFKDGRFERLTPAGERFRFNTRGRLDTIIDAFPKNRHELEYDRNGWLVRIDDRSVIADRYLELGHYRRKADPDFNAGLDEQTTSGFIEGKICRLRDYAGRDVLFFYTEEGFLIRREGMAVAGENGGFAGRAQTHYLYKDCKFNGVASGVSGTPVFTADTQGGVNGAPIAKGGDGVGGKVQVTVPKGSTAATLAGQTASVTEADGRKTEHQVDKFGHTTSIRISGAQGAASEQRQLYNDAGQLTFIRFPEGRIETRTYDTNNPVFRSRANLLSVTVDPGPRGGAGYKETYQYDPRYNLRSGDQTDANGFIHTYALRPDGREMSSVRHGTAGTETLGFNDNGQMLSSLDIRGVEMTMTYDSTTGFRSASSAGRNSTTFSYGTDEASRLGEPATITPPVGTPQQVKYNRNLLEVEVARGELVTKRAFDEQGRDTLLRDELGTGKVRTVQRAFDVKGFLTNSVTTGIEVDGVDSSLTYVYEPDEQSRVKAIHHPGGTVQTFEYDNRGFTIQMTRGAYVEEYGRDLHGNLTSVKEGGMLVATTDYDGLDRPKTFTRKTGTQDETQTRTYFTGGAVKEVAVTDPVFGISQRQTVDQIDELSRTVRRTISGMSISPVFQYTYLPLAATVTGPRMATHETWDTAGYPITSSDPIATRTFKPDGSGRIRQIDHQEDGATYTDFIDYDGLDHRVSLRDLAGLRAAFQPRADGYDLSITNGRNNSVTMEHSVRGELLRRRRADGMEFRFRHDAQRQKKYSGDPTDGFRSTYDDQFRLVKRTLRNGAPVIYSNFDPRELPTKVTMPGGTTTMEYDLQRRLTHESTVFQGTVYEFRDSYDALGRVRVETYRQDAGLENTMNRDYDPAGVLLRARFQEDGADFSVSYAYYPDGTRKTITYPSGVTVTQERDVTGRLLGISDATGNILRATSWQGNNQPRIVEIGKGMRAVNQYDPRGRMTGSRITRVSDGSVLSHLRYQYDLADNVEIRQYLHRGGKADNFSYDVAERVVRAQIGGIPTNSGLGLALVFYERVYGYQALGLDYLVTAPATGAASVVPPFAASWTGQDAFLLPAKVDGFNLGAPDPMGRVTHAQLRVRAAGAPGSVPVSATLTHNGRGNLIRIERADGLVVENHFQPGGLRYLRRTTQGGSVTGSRHFVYDNQARLLEEYERSGSALQLLARYYYANDDAPVAADLADAGSGQLHRFYYLRDGAESVVAVADAAGNVVERVWYDTFGQPVIEGRDTLAPVVRRVLGGAGGSLLLELSESVGPALADPGPGGGIVRSVADLSVSVSAPGGGQAQLVPSLAGFAPGSVILYSPSNTLSGAITITITATNLVDEWGNRVPAQTLTAQVDGVPGSVYYTAAPVPVTSVQSARSVVGSPFLFHGQYFDYDTGLVYLRARFYDPFAGMFLEPDPLGFEESVNLYAGMGNNPVSLRDPTGLGSGGNKRIGLNDKLGPSVRSIGQSKPHVPVPMPTTSRTADSIAQGIPRAPTAPRVPASRFPLDTGIALGIHRPVPGGMSILEKTANKHGLTELMNDPEGYRERVMATAMAAAKGKASIVVNVEGFAARKGLEGIAKVEDQINSSIMRFGIHHEGPGFKLSHAPDFKLTDEHKIKYSMGTTTDKTGAFTAPVEYSKTDEEIFMLYETGALHTPYVRIVEGEEGLTSHGNPYFKRTK